MRDNEIAVASISKRTPWNKGKLIGAKPPLRPNHSTLMPASLRIGHHRSISAFWKAPSAWDFCCSGVKISFPSSASR
jgi:hypothetical protein